MHKLKTSRLKIEVKIIHYSVPCFLPKCSGSPLQANYRSHFQYWRILTVINTFLVLKRQCKTVEYTQYYTNSY
jgi:hypothetical protein